MKSALVLGLLGVMLLGFESHAQSALLASSASVKQMAAGHSTTSKPAADSYAATGNATLGFSTLLAKEAPASCELKCKESPAKAFKNLLDAEAKTAKNVEHKEALDNVSASRKVIPAKKAIEQKPSFFFELWFRQFMKISESEQTINPPLLKGQGC